MPWYPMIQKYKEKEVNYHWVGKTNTFPINDQKSIAHKSKQNVREIGVLEWFDLTPPKNKE